MPDKLPKSMPFRICIYRTEDLKNVYIAHCLDLDVKAHAETIEGAMDELLKVIETQIEMSEQFDADLLHPAPENIWDMYMSAKKAHRKLPAELINRIIRNANRRLGHEVEIAPGNKDCALA